jgi:ABC-type hemin transport system ATPase subunit
MEHTEKKPAGMYQLGPWRENSLARCIMAQYSNLPFKFSVPSINNVGVVKVHIEKISGKKFGAKTITPWNQPDPNTEDE